MPTLISHEWPDISGHWQNFTADHGLEDAIEIFHDRYGRKPEFVLLPTNLWWKLSGAEEPDSLYYLYNGVKVTWHPKELHFIRLGPLREGERWY